VPGDVGPQLEPSPFAAAGGGQSRHEVIASRPVAQIFGAVERRAAR
jgi:hypothetical protein